ncbi:MAG: signal peptidase II, partial [Bacteroidota bacterium]
MLLQWSWALILGGAIGNAIDSIFYGALLNNVQY